MASLVVHGWLDPECNYGFRGGSPAHICHVANYEHHAYRFENLWAYEAIEAGVVLDRDRSEAVDLTLVTSGLRLANRSRQTELRWVLGGLVRRAITIYMTDFARVSSTTPTCGWGSWRLRRSQHGGGPGVFFRTGARYPSIILFYG